MGLGNRSARRHETVAAGAAGDASSAWSFQPGQKVMTVDGFAGTIASVDDQPIGGAETYTVELDNKMGGGQYTSSQIWATNDTTASAHTAADDYPELGTILIDRPDIALNVTSAYHMTEDDYEPCPECDQLVDPDHHGGMEDHLESEHGLDPLDYHKPGHGQRWEKTASSHEDGCEYCGGAHETDDHQDEPDEDDTHLGYGHRGIYVSHGGKDLGEFPDVETATHVALHAQHDDVYFPNMWMNGEHGPTSRPLHEATDVEGHVQRWAPNIGREGPIHQGAAPAREHGPIDSYSGKDEIGSHLVQEHGVHPNDLRVPVTIAPGHPAHPHGNNAILPHKTSRPASQEELLNHHEGLHEEGGCPVEGHACPWQRHGHTHAERDTSHLFDPSVFGDQGKRDWADFLMSDNHTGPTHLSAKDTSNEPGLDEHNHLTWGGHSPGCRDTDDYSMFGQNDAVEKQAARGLPGDPVQYSHPDHQPIVPPWAGPPWCSCGWKSKAQPNDGEFLSDHLAEVGSIPTSKQAALIPQASCKHDGEWNLHGQCKQCGYTPETEGDQECDDPHCQRTGFADGWHTKAEHMDPPERDPHSDYWHDKPEGNGPYDRCTEPGCEDMPAHSGLDHITQDYHDPDVRDLHRQVSDAFGGQDHGWLLDKGHTGPTHLSKSEYHPHHAVVGPMDSGSPCTQCAAHGMLSCQETVGKCDSCGSPRTDIYRYRSGKYEKSPESLCLDCLNSGHHLDSAHDRDEADAASIDHLARRPAGEGGFRTVWKKSASAFDPYQILTVAASDPDFRFHVTASWADVRAKAKRIRAEGGVHVTALSDGMLHAEVKGDHHVYETGIQRLPGKASIAGWSCGCKWGAYHWGASDDFSRFAGRMCSHALAVQYEAQSRGMFGRDVQIDDKKPSWVPRRVVVKYDIDDKRNVSAPTTPTRGDYGHAASRSVVSALIARSQRDGEELGDMTLALHVMGMGLPAIQAAVNDAWGEPSPPQNNYLPGPTKPKDPNENPASAGWASRPDPSSWNEAGPSGLNHTMSSLDDEAIFEPEMGKEAFLPLLALAPELLAGGEAAAAGAGAAGAAAGAGEAAGAAGAGMGVGDAINVGRGVNLVHNLTKRPDNSVENSMPQQPEGPPSRPELNTPEARNPLNYGATLHGEPEAALPFTDGDVDDDALSPDSDSFVSTGSVADIVAQFQMTAGATALQGSGSVDADSSEIAAAAREHLEKASMKTFTPGEQHQIITEGENVKASNLDRLDIAGTHYEPLEAALAANDDEDEGWLS